MHSDFQARLESKLRKQFDSKGIGYLIGAGASHLVGQGYPLAQELWGQIKLHVPEPERADIQHKLDHGAAGIENALDLLDHGGPDAGPHRLRVTDAIATHFSSLQPPLNVHKSFVAAVSIRGERKSSYAVPIFTLNYDPLLERAAELEHVRLFDGFSGFEDAFFDQDSYGFHFAIGRKTKFGFITRKAIAGNLTLYKLHGSLGWYDSPATGIRRRGIAESIPSDASRLMIPPQFRKAENTVHRPYSFLWSEFRRLIVHGPDPLNRLICIGCGMADTHVNAVIEGGLARTDFSVIIAAKFLRDEIFERWSKFQNVIVITEVQCSLNGEIGAGHPRLWDFGAIVEELQK